MEFVKSYSFKDSEEVYTNGSNLIPVFRVEQMLEHYYPKRPTNADQIRAMSDAELAEFINTVAKDSIDTITAYGTKSHTEIWEDKENTLQWLEEEV